MWYQDREVGSAHICDVGGVPKVGVVDREKRQVTATWPLTGVPSVVALALDETHHRLFGGSRNPPMLIVLDTESGKQIAQLEGVEGIDDLWYDAERDRIYASGGRGALAQVADRCRGN